MSSHELYFHRDGGEGGHKADEDSEHSEHNQRDAGAHEDSENHDYGDGGGGGSETDEENGSDEEFARRLGGLPAGVHAPAPWDQRPASRDFIFDRQKVRAAIRSPLLSRELPRLTVSESKLYDVLGSLVSEDVGDALLNVLRSADFHVHDMATTWATIKTHASTTALYAFGQRQHIAPLDVTLPGGAVHTMSMRYAMSVCGTHIMSVYNVHHVPRYLQLRTSACLCGFSVRFAQRRLRRSRFCEVQQKQEAHHHLLHECRCLCGMANTVGDALSLSPSLSLSISLSLCVVGRCG